MWFVTFFSGNIKSVFLVEEVEYQKILKDISSGESPCFLYKTPLNLDEEHKVFFKFSKIDKVIFKKEVRNG